MGFSSHAGFRTPDALTGQGQGPPGGWLPFLEWDWRHYAFYFGLPAVISLYAGLNNWAVLQLGGYETTFLFYAGHGFVPWWASGVMSYGCMRLLGRWHPPQVVVLVLGSILACVVTMPYARWITEYFAHGWLAGDLDGTRTSQHIMGQLGFLSSATKATVIWVAANLAFDRLLGLPRFRAGADPRGASPDPAPRVIPAREPAAGPEVAGDGSGNEAAPGEALRFLQRLPVAVAAQDVLALKAEQHYLRVFTPGRSFLTLYRFSDAVAEMDGNAGSQVHRSYWVRHSAIRSVRRESRKYYLELVNDIEVPISAGHQGMVRDLARGRGIPIRPPL